MGGCISFTGLCLPCRQKQCPVLLGLPIPAPSTLFEPCRVISICGVAGKEEQQNKRVKVYCALSLHQALTSSISSSQRPCEEGNRVLMLEMNNWGSRRLNDIAHYRANEGQSQNAVLVLSDPTVQALSADTVLPTRAGSLPGNR